MGAYTFKKGEQVKFNPHTRDSWDPPLNQTFVIASLDSVAKDRRSLIGHHQIIELQGYPGGKIFSGRKLLPA